MIVYRLSLILLFTLKIHFFFVFVTALLIVEMLFTRYTNYAQLVYTEPYIVAFRVKLNIRVALI